jgi:hypothetical protein
MDANSDLVIDSVDQASAEWLVAAAGLDDPPGALSLEIAPASDGLFMCRVYRVIVSREGGREPVIFFFFFFFFFFSLLDFESNTSSIFLSRKNKHPPAATRKGGSF